MTSQIKEDMIQNLEEFVTKNQWQIRPCHLYKEEYDDCTSFKDRFHQYFVHGKSINCDQWQHDYKNCKRLELKEWLAGVQLIESETERRRVRMRPHVTNNVWEKREQPPEDWNKELPESMKAEYEKTFLHIKAKELNDQKDGITKNSGGYCSIM